MELHRMTGGWGVRARERRRAAGLRDRRRRCAVERLEERVVMTVAVGWVPQGPGPIIFGGDGGITSPDGPNPVSGAIEAIAASRTNPDLVYAGAVNGGVWKTTDATAGSPHWTNLTDSALPGQSIDSLALSPLDSSGNTVFAGTGSTSSFALDGSPGFGVARTTDGGATWSVLAQATFSGRVISSIVPTSLTTDGTIGTQVVLAGTLHNSYGGGGPAGNGLFRSTDGGATFTRISGSHGLPDAGVSSVIADPTDANRFYAAVPAYFAAGGGGDAGVYESTDGGLDWTRTAALPDPNLASSFRILLAASPTAGTVYAMDIQRHYNTTFGSYEYILSDVLRSADQGTTWTPMGVPTPAVYSVGQGDIHGVIGVAPGNPDMVFIGGDAIENSPYTANIYSGLYSPTGTTWQAAVDAGASKTSPHADSRALVPDANGNLLEGNDGGIFRLVSPVNVASRHWQSVNGDITPTEAHSATYDSYSKVVFAGTQDNGTPIQSQRGSSLWGEYMGGDGGYVAVDDSATTTAKGYSIRYSSFQFFQDFDRSYWDSSNNYITDQLVGLKITSGAGTGQNLLNYDPYIGFYQPFVINTVDPSRMLIGTANIYESHDYGDTLANLGPAGGVLWYGGNYNTGNTGMAYGGYLNGVANPGLFYVASNNPNTGAPVLKYRASDGSPITTIASYPGATIEAITMDPQNDTHVFVLDQAQQVWASFDSGSTWTNLTVNLDTVANPGIGTDLRTIQIFSPSSSPINTVLLVGGQSGVWQMRRPGSAGSSWTVVASGMPNVLVYDLNYNYHDNVLTAGTLGRGVWTLSGYFRGGTSTPAFSSLQITAALPSFGPLDFFAPPRRFAGPSSRFGAAGAAATSPDSGSVAAAGAAVPTVEAQAITATTAATASPFAGRALAPSDFVAGRSPVNQALVDTDQDRFGLL